MSARCARAPYRLGDGTYRLTGQKIFITYGEHDLTDNIIHFVLARLPDAPPAIAAFRCSWCRNSCSMPTARSGARNDVRAASIEHKLGIHASPTCTMVFGDHGGAIGYLIGEENRGLACMFTMMNQARLAVGIEGVAIAERATQQALAYARERRQGRAVGAAGEGSSAIIEHPGRAPHAADHAQPDACRARDLLCDRARHRQEPAPADEASTQSRA